MILFSVFQLESQLGLYGSYFQKSNLEHFLRKLLFQNKNSYSLHMFFTLLAKKFFGNGCSNHSSIDIDQSICNGPPLGALLGLLLQKFGNTFNFFISGSVPRLHANYKNTKFNSAKFAIPEFTTSLNHLHTFQQLLINPQKFDDCTKITLNQCSNIF